MRRDQGRIGSEGVKYHRGFADESPIIDALRKLPGVVVTAVDPGSLPFEAQFSLFRATDVLVGIHGAALAWGLWLQEPGGLVEVQVGGFRCTCFPGIAAWRDLAFEQVRVDHDSEIHAVANSVASAVSRVGMRVLKAH